MTDGELLERFAGNDSSAFEELVRRHAGWIYQAARRQLGDSGLADDATQAVFLVLIRRARSLSASVPLAAWLHRTTILTCREIARKEARQKKREEAAAMMRQEQTSAEQSAWMQMAPLLESLMRCLRKGDQQAILLRYYAQRDFADVAMELGLTELTARKRVERAVQRLRKLFAGHGIEHSADVLGAAMLNHAGVGASAGMMARIVNQPGSVLARQVSAGIARRVVLGKVGLVGSAAVIVGAALSIAVAAKLKTGRAPPVLVGAQHAVRAAVVAPDDPEFDSLIQNLQASETRIKNLHLIHFAGTQERRSLQSQPWQATPGKYDGSAWFDSRGGGRVRMRFDQLVQEYTDQGTSQKHWNYESLDVGFDGKQSRYMLNSGNFVTAGPKPIHIGIRPVVQIYPYLSGLLTILESSEQPWAFAASQNAVMITHASGDSKTHGTLSAEFLKLRDEGTRFKIEQDKINGVRAIKVLVDEPNAPGDPPRTWWFDPARGYVLLQSKEFFHGGVRDPKAAWRVNVSKWKEVIPGVWFPTEAVCEEDREGHFDRYTYHVDDVIANDPKFAEGIFLPPIPIGYEVLDYRVQPVRRTVFGGDLSQ